MTPPEGSPPALGPRRRGHSFKPKRRAPLRLGAALDEKPAPGTNPTPHPGPGPEVVPAGEPPPGRPAPAAADTEFIGRPEYSEAPPTESPPAAPVPFREPPVRPEFRERGARMDRDRGRDPRPERGGDRGDRRDRPQRPPSPPPPPRVERIERAERPQFSPEPPPEPPRQPASTRSVGEAITEVRRVIYGLQEALRELEDLYELLDDAGSQQQADEREIARLTDLLRRTQTQRLVPEAQPQRRPEPPPPAPREPVSAGPADEPAADSGIRPFVDEAASQSDFEPDDAPDAPPESGSAPGQPPRGPDGPGGPRRRRGWRGGRGRRGPGGPPGGGGSPSAAGAPPGPPAL